MSKIKIFLVDDHKIIRDGLSAVFFMTEDIEVIGEAAFSDELDELLTKNTPDIIVLDIELPGMSGIEITKELKERSPEIKILILSSHTDIDSIQDAIKNGANGFLQKDSSSEELTNAIHALYNGDEYFGEEISKVLMKSYLKTIKKPEKVEKVILSDRETEILILFAEGLSYKQIAEKLFISTKTVDSHKRNILEKLELKGTVGLVKYAIKNNLIRI